MNDIFPGHPTELEQIHDALQLDACGGMYKKAHEHHGGCERCAGTLPKVDANVVYVAPSGSDDNPGTVASPMATIHAAVEKLRELGGTGNAIVLRSGTYRFTRTLQIGPMDVNLTIQAYPGVLQNLSHELFFSKSVVGPFDVSSTILSFHVCKKRQLQEQRFRPYLSVGIVCLPYVAVEVPTKSQKISCGNIR